MQFNLENDILQYNNASSNHKKKEILSGLEKYIRFIINNNGDNPPKAISQLLATIDYFNDMHNKIVKDQRIILGRAGEILQNAMTASLQIYMNHTLYDDKMVQECLREEMSNKSERPISDVSRNPSVHVSFLSGSSQYGSRSKEAEKEDASNHSPRPH